MSDPDVRRDEETRATTMEHMKLLRNRLEATTKDHIDELQAYLVWATEELSRQGDHKAANTEGDTCRTARHKSRSSELEHTLYARFHELDRELDRRTEKVEERMGARIDQRLNDLAQKLSMLLGKVSG